MPANEQRLLASVRIRGAVADILPDEGTTFERGDGICLNFRDRRGISFCVFGVIRRVPEPVRGARLELDVIHSTPPLTGLEAGELRPKVTLKFRVEESEGGLKIGLFGHLTAIRAAALHDQIEHAVRRCHTRPLPLLVDARALRTSPEDALGQFRQALTVLARAGSAIGVVLGPTSVATSQLMRLLREADLADGMVFATHEVEAIAVWNTICDELCGPTRLQSSRTSPAEVSKVRSA